MIFTRRDPREAAAPPSDVRHRSAVDRHGNEDAVERCEVRTHKSDGAYTLTAGAVLARGRAVLAVRREPTWSALSSEVAGRSV